ncbi:MAG: hypothetical protein SA378_03790 [Sedimentibacter sp.]|uniref:hypothetical protein n=1 Tax=Sedimentibacter sp. TaxID=1960295 RepID=UPI0029827D8D|nr:hypothetical protein [Sedimentibacter sp.]MDW5299244.1 hypothetical protein [Sedimentibacter sp.]
MKTRKLINILLITVMLCQLCVTSCSDNNKEDEIETPITENEINENEIPKAWEMNLSSYDVDVPYELPNYTPNVEKYEINQDLSNLFNAGQYSGFTEEQTKLIYEDGFVALMPSYDSLKMHHIYEYFLGFN